MIRVSDHAIVRYAERKHGIATGTDDTREAMLRLRERRIDVEAIRLRLQGLGEFGRRYGAKVVIADGIKVCMKEMTVTTVLSKYMASEA